MSYYPMTLYHWGIEHHTYDAVGVWEWKRIKSDVLLAKGDEYVKEFLITLAKKMDIEFTDKSEWNKDDWEYQDILTEGNYRVYFWDTEFDDIYEFANGFLEDVFMQMLKETDRKILTSEVNMEVF